jgi:hypothetical protein
VVVATEDVEEDVELKLVELWVLEAELVTEAELEDATEEEEETDELEIEEDEVETEAMPLVVVVTLDTVAKYNPTPAINKITTIITTTIAREIALRLFLSDNLRIL